MKKNGQWKAKPLFIEFFPFSLYCRWIKQSNPKVNNKRIPVKSKKAGKVICALPVIERMAELVEIEITFANDTKRERERDLEKNKEAKLDEWRERERKRMKDWWTFQHTNKTQTMTIKSRTGTGEWEARNEKRLTLLEMRQKTEEKEEKKYRKAVQETKKESYFSHEKLFLGWSLTMSRW